jgi:glycosyltransferase involved in cell wall biosynthesis
MIGDFDNLVDPSQGNLSVTGEISAAVDILPYYKDAHILLLTSSTEGFPLVILEGMSQGVVPVSTDVGEIPNFISEENNNGFLIKNSAEVDVLAEEFYKRIEYLVMHPHILRKFSSVCFDYVKANFDRRNFSQSYRQLILGEGIS